MFQQEIKSLSLKMMKRRNFKHVCAHIFSEAVKTFLVRDAVFVINFIFNKEDYSFFLKEDTQIYLDFAFK